MAELGVRLGLGGFFLGTKRTLFLLVFPRGFLLGVVFEEFAFLGQPFRFASEQRLPHFRRMFRLNRFEK